MKRTDDAARPQEGTTTSHPAPGAVPHAPPLSSTEAEQRITQSITELRGFLEAQRNPTKGAEMEQYLRNKFTCFGISAPQRLEILKTQWFKTKLFLRITTAGVQQQQQVLSSGSSPSGGGGAAASSSAALSSSAAAPSTATALTIKSKPTAGVPPTRDERALLQLVLALFAEKERDFHYVGIELIKKFERVWTSASFDELKKFLLKNANFNWWDTLDCVAIHFLGAAILNERRAGVHLAAGGAAGGAGSVRGPKKGAERTPVPSGVGIVPAEEQLDREWITCQQSFWLPRMAVLSHLLFKKADMGPSSVERLFRYVQLLLERDRLSKDEVFFIDKAMGWALRRYSVMDGEKIKTFVKNNGGKLSALTKREALKILDKKEVGEKKTGNKKTGAKKTGEKKTMDKKTGNKKTGEKKTGNKKTGEKKTGGKQ